MLDLSNVAIQRIRDAVLDYLRNSSKKDLNNPLQVEHTYLNGQTPYSPNQAEDKLYNVKFNIECAEIRLKDSQDESILKLDIIGVEVGAVCLKDHISVQLAVGDLNATNPCAEYEFDRSVIRRSDRQFQYLVGQVVQVQSSLQSSWRRGVIRTKNRDGTFDTLMTTGNEIKSFIPEARIRPLFFQVECKFPTLPALDNDSSGLSNGPLAGHRTCAAKMRVILRPLTIVTAPGHVKKIISFFSREYIDLMVLEAYVMNILAKAREATQEVLQSILRSHSTIDVSITMAAPRLIVPISPKLICLINLGTLQLNSVQKQLEDYYDEYEIALTGTQIVLLPSFKNIQKALEDMSSNTTSKMHGIRFTQLDGIQLNLQRCIAPPSVDNPGIKCNVEVGSFTTQVYPSKLQQVVMFLKP